MGRIVNKAQSFILSVGLLVGEEIGELVSRRRNLREKAHRSTEDLQAYREAHNAARSAIAVARGEAWQSTASSLFSLSY